VIWPRAERAHVESSLPQKTPRSITGCQTPCPEVFDGNGFTIGRNLGRALDASSVNDLDFFGCHLARLYCSDSALSVSSELTKSSSSAHEFNPLARSQFGQTDRRLGQCRWKGTEAIYQDMVDLTGPYSSRTRLVPSISGSKSCCTPSRLHHTRARQSGAQDLSISSRKRCVLAHDSNCRAVGVSYHQQACGLFD